MESVIARMSDGESRRIEGETVGDVYAALGVSADCGWYEGDGELDPATPIGDIISRDYGRWLIWPTHADREGPDGSGDDGRNAMCCIVGD